MYFRREKTAIKNRRVNRDSKVAFGRPPYSEISVNRYDRVNSAECTQAGNRRAEPINGAEGVLGWLIIHPATLRYVVAGTPRRTPQATAATTPNIVFPDIVASWEDAEVHTRDFVANGMWQDAVWIEGASLTNT